MNLHVVYCFLGKAESDLHKVFLWEQWESCFSLFDELLGPYAKSSFVKSIQAYEMPLKPLKGDPPGIMRMTLKPVPLGRLKWTYEDNKKWSQRSQQPDQYPIRFMETQILSTNSKTRPAEIQVFVANCDHPPDCAYNQVLTLTVEQPIYASRPKKYWDNLVQRLTPLVRAVRIGRTERPWWLERPLGNVTEGSSLAGARFTKRYDSLDLDASWQTWEYLL